MAYAFDTLSYAKRLREAGISQGQAEAHAEAAREFVMGELATKADLQAVRVDLQAVKADLQAVKADLQAMKAELQAALDTLSLRLTLRLGVMLATGLATSVGLIAAIIKL
jgi:hypothetical protein